MLSYVPLATRPIAQANSLRDYLHHYQIRLEEEKKDSDETNDVVERIFSNIEEFVRFTMVIRFNAVELQPPAEDGHGPGTNFGHGLFELACKMNHSCRPNCVWFTTQDGTCKEVRAIAPIEAGEELTVDYLGNALDSTAQRREDLFATKGFVCECDRCAAEHDDTRRFKCITYSETQKCNGFHFLIQPTYASPASLGDCICCGATSTEVYTTTVMREEITLVREINELDEAVEADCIVQVQNRIEQLEPPHQHHSLADKCYQLQGELYSNLGEYRRAAEAYAKSLDCRINILGTDYYSQATAFACEKLGDALKHVNVEEAEEAYKRAVRCLELMRGAADEDPYVKCALKKLLTVQNRRFHIDNLPTETNLKGIAETGLETPPASDFSCQVCGNPAIIPSASRDVLSYCCELHKRVHYANVKKSFGFIEEEKVWDQVAMLRISI
jgi:tetratricopeptide (TPR) repeat protein